ncbi:MAG: glycosyl hydrolase family 43 [Chitinophagaceae bacterium]|nr:MAG: glycosyl hydrolase family 43 [Chitinophagaceae bacterium]
MDNLLRYVFYFLLVSVSGCDKGSGGEGTPAPVPPGPANTFTNPLLSSGPDPWVIRKGDSYYYTHTQGNKISLWKTSKMSDLANAPVQTAWTAPATGPNSKNVWAPELHFLANKWYLYYTAGASADLATQRTFVLENTSDDPRTGTWVDKGKIVDAAADFFAIDGTVFSHNNKDYFIWSGQASATDRNQRLYIAAMSDPWTLSGARKLISSPELAWETNGAPPAVNEAPEIIKNTTGKVFLVYSASGCWTDDYALGLLTLKDGGDPLVASDWIKSPQPVFIKNTSNGAYGPGHNTFFKSVDGSEDWILYHANPASGLGCGDMRNPRMQKFVWKPDGTPDFGQPVRINTAIVKPAGE